MNSSQYEDMKLKEIVAPLTAGIIHIVYDYYYTCVVHAPFYGIFSSQKRFLIPIYFISFYIPFPPPPLLGFPLLNENLILLLICCLPSEKVFQIACENIVEDSSHSR